jgi:TRAP-type mannitol/chloroaromatic compound transport system permease small subunit
MIKSYFDIVDNKLPVVRALQILALLLFLVPFLTQIPAVVIQHFGRGNVSVETVFTSFIPLVGMMSVSFLFQPMILLALAEIIKIMKVKSE